MRGKQSIHSQIYDLEYKLNNIRNDSSIDESNMYLTYLGMIKRGELDYLREEEIHDVLRDIRMYVHQHNKK